MAGIHAIVQAGGLGRRIGATAGSTPKPMLPIAGTPMIERLFRQIVAAGIARITVVIGPNGAAIRARIAEVVMALPAGLDVDFFEERGPLGNAGALGEIPTGDCDVLLCFADLVTDIDFSRLARIHAERGCNVTLTSHHEHHQLTVGELIVDGDAVRGYQEMPRKAFLVSSGIALFDARAIAVARVLPRPFGLSDLVVATLAAGCSATHWLHCAYWIDVNTAELLARARDDSFIRDAAAWPRSPLVARQAG
jgi:NDP-sugar pyrophosphorylase family protein